MLTEGGSILLTMMSKPSIEKDIEFIYAVSFLVTDLMAEAVLLPAAKAV